eukprot:867122_1
MDEKPKRQAWEDQKRPGLRHPTSIRVPKNVLEKMTAAVRRYWQINHEYWDCIIFYKVGRFYEIYDHDAVTCHNELGLQFMAGDARPHVGLPEPAFEKFAEQLVARGFKVARVDQTETADQMRARVKRERTKDKMVKRALTMVVTPGVTVDPNMN